LSTAATCRRRGEPHTPVAEPPPHDQSRRRHTGGGHRAQTGREGRCQPSGFFGAFPVAGRGTRGACPHTPPHLVSFCDGRPRGWRPACGLRHARGGHDGLGLVSRRGDGHVASLAAGAWGPAPTNGGSEPQQPCVRPLSTPRAVVGSRAGRGGGCLWRVWPPRLVLWAAQSAPRTPTFGVRVARAASAPAAGAPPPPPLNAPPPPTTPH